MTGSEHRRRRLGSRVEEKVCVVVGVVRLGCGQPGNVTP
jgi:hypothetical protein